MRPWVQPQHSKKENLKLKNFKQDWGTSVQSPIPSKRVHGCRDGTPFVTNSPNFTTRDATSSLTGLPWPASFRVSGAKSRGQPGCISQAPQVMEDFGSLWLGDRGPLFLLVAAELLSAPGANASLSDGFLDLCGRMEDLCCVSPPLGIPRARKILVSSGSADQVRPTRRNLGRQAPQGPWLVVDNCGAVCMCSAASQDPASPGTPGPPCGGVMFKVKPAVQAGAAT